MRVITGSARGRKLVSPQGDAARPTTDMVKEGIFSSIQFLVPGARVLDLFAGSGQLGIEALSRGASFASFVDHTATSLQAIRQNIELCGFQEQSRVYPMDHSMFLDSTAETFDIAFLDPPYDQHLLVPTLKKLVPKMNEDGVIMCECRKGEELPEEVGDFRRVREYRYGKIMVYQYRRA